MMTNNNNKDLLGPSHFIGKGIRFLQEGFIRKVKLKGVVPSLALTYLGITILTIKFLPPYIKPFPVCILATGAYGLLTWWSKLKTCEYYIITFRRVGFLKGFQRIYYSGKTIEEGGNIVWDFKSRVPTEHFKKNHELLSSVLGNVVDIRKSKKKRNVIEIETGRAIDYRDMAKNGDSVGMKIYAALRVLNIETDNYSEIDDNFKESVAFNCNITRKEMEKVITEIEHITNLENIKLFSDKFFDFRMTVKKKVESFDFKELLFNTKIKKDNIIIGMNDSGLITVNFKKKYHWLIAGSTGFGKSNESHVIISSALQTAEDTSFFLLDPKKSELKRYRDIDRVYYSGDRDEILGTLRKLRKEMDRRNKLIEDEKFINDIDSWNEDKTKAEKFGYVFIYIEEMAQLMLDPDKDFVAELTNLLVKLLSLSRSAGFRFFFTTQYPKKEVVPTLVKNCLINRLGFLVSNVIESNVIMDSNCLTELKDIGEMKFKNNGRISDVKAPFLKKTDIIPVVCHLEERHSKFPSKPHIIDFVSSVPNADTPRAATMPAANLVKNTAQEEEKTVAKINSKAELLEFYLNNYDNIVPSLADTVPLINIGRTKAQKYRSGLIEDGDLEVVDQKTYIASKYRIKVVK